MIYEQDLLLLKRSLDPLWRRLTAQKFPDWIQQPIQLMHQISGVFFLR
jgi:hypothetical protein